MKVTGGICGALAALLALLLGLSWGDALIVAALFVFVGSISTKGWRQWPILQRPSRWYF